MKKILLLISIFLFITTKSQNLSPDRISNIKSATVRITIDSLNDVGTGFFINDNGWILTCWHVIQHAISKTSVNKIWAQLNTGEKIEYGIYNGNPVYIKLSFAYDFCLMIPIVKSNKKTKYLSLGNYNELAEGETVYTCGYPLGITQQFVSQGIVSTKYVDTVSIFIDNKLAGKYARAQSLLDLTLIKATRVEQ